MSKEQMLKIVYKVNVIARVGADRPWKKYATQISSELN